MVRLLAVVSLVAMLAFWIPVVRLDDSALAERMVGFEDAEPRLRRFYVRMVFTFLVLSTVLILFLSPS